MSGLKASTEPSYSCHGDMEGWLSALRRLGASLQAAGVPFAYLRVIPGEVCVGFLSRVDAGEFLDVAAAVLSQSSFFGPLAEWLLGACVEGQQVDSRQVG